MTESSPALDDTLRSSTSMPELKKLAMPYPARRFAVAAALALFADFLFWDRSIGLSAAIMIAALAVGVGTVNPARLAWKRVGLGIAIITLGVAPLVEDVTPLSMFIGVFAISAFALVMSGSAETAWPWFAAAVARLLVLAPFRLIPDVETMQRERHAPTPSTFKIDIWIVPIACSALFLGLLAAGNPLIERWMPRFDLPQFFRALHPGRILLIIIMFNSVWGIVCVRSVARKRRELAIGTAAIIPSKQASLLFGPEAIIRSLVLFNILFALQSGLDLAFLWRDVTLPDGMSYATYAHQGAYPLMLTAALAGAFAMLAFGPGSAMERRPLGRVLVFAWIGQNVLLVMSSILRLKLYVDVYSLSYWRVAAFIWMVLVAAGLVLIVVRIARHRSNEWLVGGTLAVTIATLYACCFVNFAALIATHNVHHFLARDGGKYFFDARYLSELGPQALPAIHRLPASEACKAIQVSYGGTRNFQFADLALKQADWRQWTFRDHQLLRRLETLLWDGPTCRNFTTRTESQKIFDEHQRLHEAARMRASTLEQKAAQAALEAARRRAEELERSRNKSSNPEDAQMPAP